MSDLNKIKHEILKAQETPEGAYYDKEEVNELIEESIDKFIEKLNLPNIKHSVMYEYPFYSDTYGVVILIAEDKNDAKNKIEKLELDTLPDKIELSDIDECECEDGVIYIKTGEYEE